jgi:hypothetical protein
VRNELGGNRRIFNTLVFGRTLHVVRDTKTTALKEPAHKTPYETIAWIGSEVQELIVDHTLPGLPLAQFAMSSCALQRIMRSVSPLDLKVTEMKNEPTLAVYS